MAPFATSHLSENEQNALTKAYDKLKTDSDRIAAFIKAAGIPDGEVTFSAIHNEKIYQKEVQPGFAPQGGIPAGAPLPPPTMPAPAASRTVGSRWVTRSAWTRRPVRALRCAS